jgi:hypothetical protein
MCLVVVSGDKKNNSNNKQTSHYQGRNGSRITEQIPKKKQHNTPEH